MMSIFHTFSQVKFLKTQKNGLSFISFENPNKSELLGRLNNEYGYRSVLMAMIYEAPNGMEYDEIKAAKLSQLEEIVRKKEISLASIDLEISYNNHDFLVINKIIAFEGYNKRSNSLHSDYPYIDSEIYDLKNKKELISLAEILDERGMKFVKSLAQKELKLRATAFCKTAMEDCRIGHGSVCVLLDSLIKIQKKDGLHSANLDPTYFDFSMDGTFLHLYSNDQNHENLLCGDPLTTLEIPWVELISFMKPNFKSRFEEIQKSIIIRQDSSYTLTQEFLNLLPLPSEDMDSIKVKKHQPYVVKGDVIQIIYQLDNWCKVVYQNASGNKVAGWIQKEKLLFQD